ncbi:MAG TPA: hypothetical protein DDW49_09865 [Deltaproteobacteria bacterium]|nr:MAG: hypothetical protein A2048_01655 [Deltaproteobacteria bacterium GWA2_45_12]HBF13669.1 hypothetical protein [Deltaproteobacteria bacterium]
MLSLDFSHDKVKKVKRGIMSKDKPSQIDLFFGGDVELKGRFQDFIAKTPQAEIEANFKKFKRYLAGEMTWAEIKNISKEQLGHVAKIAYLKYKRGEYPVAESLFKGLSVMDHTNWYFRAALGAIYQKQNQFQEAIDEYTMALGLNEKEITSLTNRGECYMRLKNYPLALKDFDQAANLDPKGQNAWAKRARVLKKNIVDQGHGGQ